MTRVVVRVKHILRGMMDNINKKTDKIKNFKEIH